jgi:hypothetical protein
LGGTAVYFDTLEYQGSGDKFTRDQRSSHIWGHSPMQLDYYPATAPAI